MSLSMGRIDFGGAVSSAAMVPAGMMQNLDTIVVLALYRTVFGIASDMVPSNNRYVREVVNAAETVGEHLFMKTAVKGV
jgi:hypothetical protein